MRSFFVAVVALAALGCDYETVVPLYNGDGTCVPEEVTRTRVPSMIRNGDDMVLLCNICDVAGCDDLGGRCDVEGALCDFYGKLGVCRGCCDSEYGELHCGLAN